MAIHLESGSHSSEGFSFHPKKSRWLLNFITLSFNYHLLIFLIPFFTYFLTLVLNILSLSMFSFELPSPLSFYSRCTFTLHLFHFTLSLYFLNLLSLSILSLYFHSPPSHQLSHFLILSTFSVYFLSRFSYFTFSFTFSLHLSQMFFLWHSTFSANFHFIFSIHYLTPLSLLSNSTSDWLSPSTISLLFF